nr:hypothetical protein [Clostridia bacterium]
GGGGSGACDYHSGTDYNCIGGGKGGYGGYGAPGQAGRGGNAHCDHQDVPGGNGGGGGGNGSAGSSKSATTFTVNTNTNTKWTITFQGATSNATQEYTFESTTIAVPDYVPTGKNLFLGWRVATYGYNTNGTSSSKPLTTAETILYQPGTNIKTAQGTYGNIVLKPVTMPYEGKIAQDVLNVAKKYFASTSPTTPTYYTYAVQAYLDNVKANVGTMSFNINGKNYKVASSASNPGLYSLTLETNVATFTAKLDGVDITGTLNKGTNNVYFESMKVRVTGNDDVQSITLSGSGAPVLQKDDEASSALDAIYSVIKQKGADTNTYNIIINGENIPAEIGVAKFGTTATIPYCKVSVDLNTNMDIEGVELIDADKNSIVLIYNNERWTTSVLMDDDTTYTVYANGFNTKVDTQLNQTDIVLSAQIYEFKLVTRINGTVSASVAKLTVNGKSTTMKTGLVLLTKSAPASDEYWSYVVVNNEPVTVEANGTQVTTVTPNENLGNTYIDYFTVEYDSGDATGSVPVDDNVYLAGEDVTILSYEHLSTGNNDTYLAGWSAGGNNYTEGDVATISGPLVLRAVISSDLLKVHYVDYFGELEVKSRLDLTDRLVAYDGDKALLAFNDYGRKYTLKGWVLDIDGTKTIYPSGTLTDFVAGDVLGDSAEEINVYFTAVYDIDYLNSIHFELELSDDDEDDGIGQTILGNIGEKFTVNYRVVVNDGVNVVLLIPQFNKNAFKIANITVDNTTALGTATLTANLDSNPCKIAIESTDLYNGIGEIMVVIEYEIVNNIPGKYTDFGFVLDYPEDTTSEVDNNTRSNAWYILSEPGLSAIHNEIRIYVDNTISVIIQAAATITIAEQNVIYHGESLTVGHVYLLATAFDSTATYYEFIDGEFVLAEDITASNFGDKYYYVDNSLDDVIFVYSALGQQVFCVNPATFTIKWYTYDSVNDAYTEIAAPKNVGDYYVGISATASDFVYGVEEEKQIIHIVKADATYTIHDKTSVWSEEIVALTGEITEGTVYGDDNLNIVLSTAATSQSNVGNYTITGTYDNDNYNVTIVNGNYEITKKQIELGLDATAKFNDGSFTYDGSEKTISATIAEFYQDILSVSYTGGEDGCSGNGAINVLFNEDNEVIGYTITAHFTINAGYIQNCEFVKDGNDEDIDTLSAVLTITINGITKAQFEDLIAQFVEFSVVDGETDHILVPVNNAMSYDKVYDAISEYAKVVVSLENNSVKNDKISATVIYKLDGLESIDFNAANSFDYSNYRVKNANVYVVSITFVAGRGYAFEAEVNPTYTITMTIQKKALTINASASVAYLDDMPEITIDDGTDAWVEGENYATYGIDDIQGYTSLIETSYDKGDNAGTLYTLEWTEGAVLAEVLYNYALTLTTTSGNIVNKRIVNVDDYEFIGYSALYDGEDHDLEIFKGESVLTASDALVAFRIEIGEDEKYSVKDVVDSGAFVATLILKDTNNYAFSESDDWTVDSDKTSASLTKEVVVAPAPLIVEVAYTKTTATFSLSGFVGDEDQTVLTDFSYIKGSVVVVDSEEQKIITLEDTVAIGDTMIATAAGTVGISAVSSNANYGFSIHTVVVYAISFVSGYYDQAVAGSGFVPQNIPETQFIFSGVDIDGLEESDAKGAFKADVPAETPTLRHYTFVVWSAEDDAQAAFNFADTVIEDSITLYAVWQENATYTLTYMYKIDKQSEWHELAVDTLYTDDKLVYGDTVRLLAQVNWFIGDGWYLDDEFENRLMNNSYRNADAVLYGEYRFDIGIGDVNADGSVDANDITLYRQWIVGGYQMTEVESGDEWITATDEAFDIGNIYFVKRVADANAQTSLSVLLGDNSLDIRDVSTIRMALVGGFGVDVVTGVETTYDSVVIISVSEIDNVSKLLLAVGSGKKAKLSKDIDESVSIVDIDNMQKNIVIDLNGKTITVPSFSIALASGFDGKIEIYNGSIIATGGISLTAASGTVILNNVSMFDENGEFNLAAASNSLHFVGNVEFRKNDGNGNSVAANVVIPSTTHVVVESGATLILKSIVVDQVGNSALSIELNNSQVAEIIIDGAYTASGNNQSVIKPLITANTFAELQSAAENGYNVRLGSDVAMEAQVVFTESATLDLNGKTLYNNGDDIWNTETFKWSFISVQGGTLTIVGNGKMLTKEGDCYAADVRDGANLVIESGEFIGNVHAVYVYEGSLTVNGGKFSVQQVYSATKPYEFTLNVYDANRINGTASITVNGGSYYKFNPANCAAEGEGTNFVADGYSVNLSGDYYTVL